MYLISVFIHDIRKPLCKSNKLLRCKSGQKVCHMTTFWLGYGAFFRADSCDLDVQEILNAKKAMLLTKLVKIIPFFCTSHVKVSAF